MSFAFILDANIDQRAQKLLKEGLLQLGNLLALRTSKRRDVPPNRHVAVGLGYIKRNTVTQRQEVHMVHLPKRPFILRDFHHAVTSLASTLSALLQVPVVEEALEEHGQVSSLSLLIDNEEHTFWDSFVDNKRIFLISSNFSESSSTYSTTLENAALKCISVDFIHVVDKRHEPSSAGLPDFAHSISEFENCFFHSLKPDHWSVQLLVKNWLQQIVGTDCEGSVELLVAFGQNLTAGTKTLACTAHPTVVWLADSVEPCQTCRCHGIPLESPYQDSEKHKQCPVTAEELSEKECHSDTIRIGPDTVLHHPSFKSPPVPLHWENPTVTFSVLNRVDLSSLSEGLLFGIPHAILPSSYIDVDLEDSQNLNLSPELNQQVFSALCRSLTRQSSGLLCSSSINLDTRSVAFFPCFYVLLPGDGCSLLAKRVAASEELLPLPSVASVMDGVEASEIIASEMEAALGQVAHLPLYDPLTHERGCHRKLASLVKESILVRPTAGQVVHQIRSGTRNLHKAPYSPPAVITQPARAHNMQSCSPPPQPYLGQTRTTSSLPHHPNNKSTSAPHSLGCASQPFVPNRKKQKLATAIATSLPFLKPADPYHFAAVPQSETNSNQFENFLSPYKKHHPQAQHGSAGRLPCDVAPNVVRTGQKHQPSQPSFWSATAVLAAEAYASRGGSPGVDQLRPTDLSQVNTKNAVTEEENNKENGSENTVRSAGRSPRLAHAAVGRYDKQPIGQGLGLRGQARGRGQGRPRRSKYA